MAMHPRPSGWYCVGLSSEIRAGQVTSRVLFGRSFAVYRTEAGVPTVLDATCPHLGADLSLGRVCGEHLRCPFHGFEFDRTGRCAATPYQGAAPRRARTDALPVREQNGFVLAYWDERGEAPTWFPEVLPDGGWLPPKGRVFELTSHPFDTTENSVDIGHFETVHGFRDVTVSAPLETHGPLLIARYGFTYSFGPLRFHNRFTVRAWGVGYSFVEVHTDTFDVWSRLWVLATPVADGKIELRLAASGPVEPRGRAHGPLLGRVIRAAALRGLVHDAGRDFEIWSHRRHVAKPMLARGDGPVAAYRAWTKQFDPDRAPSPRTLNVVEA